MWHGWADSGSAPLGSLNYFDAVRRTMGAMRQRRRRWRSTSYPASIIAAAVRPRRGQTTCRNSSRGGRTRFSREPVAVSFEASATDPTVTKTITVEPHTPSSEEFGDRTEWVGIDHYQTGRHDLVSLESRRRWSATKGRDRRSPAFQTESQARIDTIFSLALASRIEQTRAP